MIKLIDISFLLEAAKSGQNVVCILRFDTNVFALLACWVNLADLQCKVQMERWDGSVSVIYAICAEQYQKCLQLLLVCMHALSGCDTTSYPSGKGNVTALNNMYPECTKIYLSQKEDKSSDGFPSNICKSSATHAWGSSSNHVVESSRL